MRVASRLPRTLIGWTLIVTWLLAWAVMLWMVARIVRPTFHDMHLLGIHDWDPQEELRYLAVKTLRVYHQFPFWNPYTCGGHPAWGGVEGDTIVVSPFLPAYLALPFAVALRVELVGSALLSMLGAWLFAGRFTRSPAVRAFVVVVFAVNGRWTLQATAGHPWHYAYEWMPWALYFLDRAIAKSIGGKWPTRDVVCAGGALAMMVYTGGVYPLPQTIVVMALWTILYGAIVRDWRPVACAVAAGLASFALSAPKLLPTLELFSRFPRFTDSPEWMDLSVLLAILTARDQDFGSRPANTSHWGWHEWGMYIGIVPLAVLLLAALVGRGERLNALKWTAAVLVALGFGSFHPYAPWSLLHGVSLFRSQHVPSRWLYPGLLVSSAVAAMVLEGAMTRSRAWRPLLEVAAMAAVAWIARDIAEVARLPLVHAFEKAPPLAQESTGTFRTEVHMPPELGYPVGGEWAPPALPVAMANIGTIDCSTFFGFHSYYRDHNNHAPGLGAKGRGEPGYRGEAYVIEAGGEATVTEWTPNRVVVKVSGARPGEHLALNQNYDPGWSANGQSALDWADVPAIRIETSNMTVVFLYRPRTLWVALAIFGASAGTLIWLAGRRLRLRSRAKGRFTA